MQQSGWDLLSGLTGLAELCLSLWPDFGACELEVCLFVPDVRPPALLGHTYRSFLKTAQTGFSGERKCVQESRDQVPVLELHPGGKHEIFLMRVSKVRLHGKATWVLSHQHPWC